jgi:DNA-directed RNA polymerase subunit N (RpoN/RPB10)
MPIRCFTCGKVMRHAVTYDERVNKNGEDASKVLDEFGYKRGCCRRMYMTNVDFSDIMMMYRQPGEEGFADCHYQGPKEDDNFPLIQNLSEIRPSVQMLSLDHTKKTKKKSSKKN